MLTNFLMRGTADRRENTVIFTYKENLDLEQRKGVELQMNVSNFLSCR